MAKPLNVFDIPKFTATDWMSAQFYLVNNTDGPCEINRSNKNEMLCRKNGKCVLSYNPGKHEIKTSFSVSEFADFILEQKNSGIKNYLFNFAKVGFRELEKIPVIAKSMQVKMSQTIREDSSLNPNEFYQSNQADLDNYNTLLFYHNHIDISTYVVLARAVKAYSEKGVKEIFLEFPASANLILELFNKTGDDEYLKELFKCFQVEQMFRKEVETGLDVLLKSAYQHKIKCVAVDSAAPQEKQSAEKVIQERDNRNYIIASNIISNMQLLPKNHRAIGLFGHSHSEISSLVRVLSKNDKSNISYGLASKQLLSDDLYLLRRTINLINMENDFDRFIEIPNFVNQQSYFASMQFAMQAREYISNTVKFFKDVCSCGFFSKKDAVPTADDSDQNKIKQKIA